MPGVDIEEDTWHNNHLGERLAKYMLGVKSATIYAMKTVCNCSVHVEYNIPYASRILRERLNSHLLQVISSIKRNGKMCIGPRIGNDFN